MTEDRQDLARAKEVDESVLRKRVVNYGLRYYKYRQRIAYSQTRPTQLRWPKFTTKLDCSGLVAAVMHKCKVNPHVDWRYTNTWVQIRFGREVKLKDIKPGDVVFYGTARNNPTHEALYIGDGKVLSHGHYPMGIYPVDYRPDRVMIRDFIATA